MALIGVLIKIISNFRNEKEEYRHTQGITSSTKYSACTDLFPYQEILVCAWSPYLWGKPHSFYLH
jgi:hypothetical protein